MLLATLLLLLLLPMAVVLALVLVVALVRVAAVVLVSWARHSALALVLALVAGARLPRRLRLLHLKV